MNGYVVLNGRNKDTSDDNLNIKGAYASAKFSSDKQIPLTIQQLSASGVSLGGIVTRGEVAEGGISVVAGSKTLLIAEDDDITVS